MRIVLSNALVAATERLPKARTEDWFNHRRLLEPIGNAPPAELELAYYRQQNELALAA